jgi:hypothetical protein
MRREVIGGLAALVLATSAGGVLGGCGSQSNDASVASTPAPSTGTGATTGASTTTSTRSTPTTTTVQTSTASEAPPASAAGGTTTPGGTHTAPEPAFTEQEAHTEGLKEAVGELQARGYTANETSQYHPSQTLRVLVGTNSGAGEQAFFFVDGRYVGTDTKEPSASIDVISQSDTEVALGYSLYRSGDALSSPSGGRATVHFALNDGKLTALDPIPAASSSTGLSRR